MCGRKITNPISGSSPFYPQDPSLMPVAATVVKKGSAVANQEFGCGQVAAINPGFITRVTLC